MLPLVFMNYTGTPPYLTPLFEVLRRLVQVEPYVAEWANAAGMPLVDKIRAGLHNTKCMVSILTTQSEYGVWQQEEIGYAIAKDIPIIPLKEDSVTVKGFLEGRQWLQIQPYNLRYTSYQMIAALRNYLPYLKDFKMTCGLCGHKFNGPLPSHQEINDAIAANLYFIWNCPNCHKDLRIDPMDFSAISSSTSIPTGRGSGTFY